MCLLPLGGLIWHDCMSLSRALTASFSSHFPLLSFALIALILPFPFFLFSFPLAVYIYVCTRPDVYTQTYVCACVHLYEYMCMRMDILIYIICLRMFTLKVWLNTHSCLTNINTFITLLLHTSLRQLNVRNQMQLDASTMINECITSW